MELSVLTNYIVILLSSLLLIGVLATKFSTRFGLPALVLFIVVGMVLNRILYYDNTFVTQLVGTFALIIILFEGGMQTKFQLIRPIIPAAVSLATLGVVLTTTVVGISAIYILNLSAAEGMLIGAIVGSTDAAAVFSVLGEKNIKQRITATLEAESGSNDPMAVFLTVSLIEWILKPDQSIWTMLGSFVLNMGLGLILGLAFGWAARKAINNVNFDSSGLYPVMAIAFAILTYGVTAMIGGSGLLAVYIMALVLGNSDLTYRQSILHFNKGFGWMMQITMFVMLGLLVFPADLINIAVQGLVLSLILMLIARPIGVFLSMLFTKFTFKDKILISWAGLRGAVPIVLATYPLMSGLPNGKLFFNVVFFVVFTSAVIQGTTITPLAVKLGLTDESGEAKYSLLELVGLGKTKSEINHLHIHAGMRVIGKELQQLSLPDDVLITAVIRGEQIVTPRGNTVVAEGDTLYILGPKNKRECIKDIFSYRDDLPVAAPMEVELETDHNISSPSPLSKKDDEI